MDRPPVYQLFRQGHRWVSEVGVLTRARGPLECAVALSATASGQVTTHEAWSSLARMVGL